MISKKITSLALALVIAGSSMLSVSGESVALAAPTTSVETNTSIRNNFFNSNFWNSFTQRRVMIDEIAPEEGPTGTTVTLTGKRFTDESIVRFGGGMISDTTVSDNGKILTFTVPDEMGRYCAPYRICTAIAYEVTPGEYDVRVQNGYRISNTVSFEVTEGDTNPDPEEELSILSIEGPSALMLDEEGTWDVVVGAESEGNLQYSVKWGDEGAGLMRMLGFDETEQASSSFTHTYQTPGTYQPEFTVTDEEGNTVSKLAASVVVGEEEAVPEITSVDPTNGTQGTQVTLIGTGFDADSVVRIGTTTVSSSTVVNHTKIMFTVPSSTPGTYTVSVSDDDGTSNTVELTIKEKVQKGKVSIAGINAPSRLATGETGTWTVDATTNLSGNLQYSVDWGEGTTFGRFGAKSLTTQSSATFTHVYEMEGVYKPTFTVTDEQGNKATVGASVRVTEAD